MPRCAECPSPIDPDQRYCLECGTATEQAPRPADLGLTQVTGEAASAPGRITPAAGRPALRALATAATCVLGVGLLIGSGLGGSSFAGTPVASVIDVALPDSGPSDGPREAPGDDDVASEDLPASDDRGAWPAEARPGERRAEPALQSPGAREQEPATGQDERRAPDAEPLSGIVVHARARSYVIALDDGRLRTVHAKDAVPQVGEEVDQTGERLHNGTYRAAGFVVIGSQTRATIRGSVPFADHAKGVYTVSAPGASMLVRGTAASLPTVGDEVVVRIRILPADPAPRAAPQLVQEAVEQRDKATDPLDLAGKLKAIDTERRTLTLPADDLGESQSDLAVTVPDEIELASFRVGDELALTVRVLPGGALALTGASHNERADAADDGARAIGDQVRARRAPGRSVSGAASVSHDASALP